MFTARYEQSLFRPTVVNRVETNEGFCCQILLKNILSSLFKKFADEFCVGVLVVTWMKLECILRKCVGTLCGCFVFQSASYVEGESTWLT